MKSQSISTAKAAEELLASVEYILLDIDGVVWSGQHVIPNIPQTLRHLRSCGKQIRFLTNNASVSRAGLVQQFYRRGIEDVQEHEIYNSGFAAALRLQRLMATDKTDSRSTPPLVEGNVFVVGEEGLHEELQRVLAPGYITYGLELHDAEQCGGYNVNRVASAWTQRVLPTPYKQLTCFPSSSSSTVGTESSADHRNGISLADLAPAAVVVGLDLHFNMLKLAYASLCLQKTHRRSGGEDTGAPNTVHFIATNEDPQIPVGADGVLLPGAGGMVSALRAVCGRPPDVVCGKPHVDMARILFEAEGITDAQQCLMVGDRLTTDVAFGSAAGCRTMLVLTGAETEEDVMRAARNGEVSMLPDYVAPSLAVFMPVV